MENFGLCSAQFQQDQALSDGAIAVTSTVDFGECVFNKEKSETATAHDKACGLS